MSDGDHTAGRHSTDWHVTIHLYENREQTGALALLDAGNHELWGRGEAHRSPYDPDIPRIGDGLAVGRALMGLGRKLLDEAEQDIGMIWEERPAGPRSRS